MANVRTGARAVVRPPFIRGAAGQFLQVRLHTQGPGLLFDHPGPVAMISIVCNTSCVTRFRVDVEILRFAFFVFGRLRLRRTAYQHGYTR